MTPPGIIPTSGVISTAFDRAKTIPIATNTAAPPRKIMIDFFRRSN